MKKINLFKKKLTYFYTEDEMKEYQDYIESNFGQISGIIHELVSPDIHLDIIVIEPTPEHNFYKLITLGMGAYQMNVPKQLRNRIFDRAELVLYLPPTWDIISKKEEDYWPIRYLKTIARLPLYTNSWISLGHTIASNENNTPFANKTEFNSILLLNATNLKEEELGLILKSDKEINLYQIFPLYLEELEYKLENGLHSLLSQFEEEDLNPIININRRNYCKNNNE